VPLFPWANVTDGDRNRCAVRRVQCWTEIAVRPEALAARTGKQCEGLPVMSVSERRSGRSRNLDLVAHVVQRIQEVAGPSSARAQPLVVRVRTGQFPSGRSSWRRPGSSPRRCRSQHAAAIFRIYNRRMDRVAGRERAAGMAVSAPVLESIEKPDTSFGCDSAAYRWVAVWSTTNPLGEPPVATECPPPAVRAPLVQYPCW